MNTQPQVTKQNFMNNVIYYVTHNGIKSKPMANYNQVEQYLKTL